MFNRTVKKVKDLIENPSPGFALGVTVGVVGACGAFLILNKNGLNDPMYTITKSDFIRAALEDDVLGIRNDLGHFKFFMDRS